MARIRVLIRNKPGVFDPEGEAIHGGIERLGYDNVEGVRVGKVVDIEIDDATVETDDPEEIEAEIEEICSEFLVNPVIERYSIESIERD